jgi:hypothetical protein
LEQINKQLERAYNFAMAERAACMTMTRPSDGVTAQVADKFPLFRFMDFPSEIREQVLDLLLATELESNWQHQPYKDHLLFYGHATLPFTHYSGMCPEILRTFKRLLREALSILYKKSNFKLLPDVSPLKFGHEDFPGKLLGRIGTKNIAVIKKLWLPGDPALYPDSGSKPRRKTHTCLGRLLEKYSYLCHLKLLVFQVDLMKQSRRDDLDQPIDALQEHLDLLGLKGDWDKVTDKLCNVLLPDLEYRTQRLKLRKISQEVNRSVFTSMVLRLVKTFRARCRDAVLLCKTGYTSDRALMLSRKVLTTQYGQVPTELFSPWTDDFAVDEKIGPRPLRVDIGRRLVYRTTEENNVIVD